MSDKKDYAAIANLESQLQDHLVVFEQWKIDNSRQKGTPSYNEYVAKFADWERDIRARIAGHQGTLAESGPKNVDSIIDELLDNVGIDEFMFALANVHMNDKTFVPSFIQEFKNITNGSNAAEPQLVVPAAQFYPTYTPTGYTYSSPQAVASSIPSWTRPIVPTSSNVPPPVHDFQKKTTSAPFRDFSV